MSKFKEGDRVKVKKNLQVHGYGEDGEFHMGIPYPMEGKTISCFFINEMEHLLGEIVTIKKISKYGTYRINECGNYWTDEMFEDEVVKEE